MIRISDPDETAFPAGEESDIFGRESTTHGEGTGRLESGDPILWWRLIDPLGLPEWRALSGRGQNSAVSRAWRRMGVEAVQFILPSSVFVCVCRRPDLNPGREVFLSPYLALLTSHRLLSPLY